MGTSANMVVIAREQIMGVCTHVRLLGLCRATIWQTRVVEGTFTSTTSSFSTYVLFYILEHI